VNISLEKLIFLCLKLIVSILKLLNSL